jgi:hypothetical protein
MLGMLMAPKSCIAGCRVKPRKMQNIPYVLMPNTWQMGGPKKWSSRAMANQNAILAPGLYAMNVRGQVCLVTAKRWHYLVAT